MCSIVRKHAEFLLVLEAVMHRTIVVLAMLWSTQNRPGRNRRKFCLIDRLPGQLRNMRRLVESSDEACKDMLRIDRIAFARLCSLLETLGGLTDSRNINVQEKVAMFLTILSHHTKNRSVRFQFKRSGQTVSKHFYSVLNAVLRLHSIFLVEPDAVPDDSTDPRWGSFKGCLGALDGTYIDVHVPAADKERNWNRKGHVTVNVLGVCDTNMRFVYVLTGWEGSAADLRVLRDAVNRTHGLKVPTGKYYLCDNGYPNCEGFLTPYKGVRYHLSEWSSRRSQNSQEYFNIKHTRARNVIERTFGLLKMRWGILRSPSWYPIKTHNKIIMACCLLHNFIRNEIAEDPLEHLVDEFMHRQQTPEGQGATDYIDNVETSTEWNNWRDALAQNMFNEWSNRG
ncbi:hypothetical protein ACS0TY_030774 [Phlomoides rotata]